MLLDLVGLLHEGDRLVDLDAVHLWVWAGGGESEEGTFGLLWSLVLDEPPRRFRGEADADEDRDYPHPLQGKGKSVRPLGSVVREATEGRGGDELADEPAQVDAAGEIGT